MMNKKKPLFWILIIILAGICIAVTVLLVTGPSPKKVLLTQLKNGAVTAFDSPAEEWCYQLNQHDMGVLERSVSSSRIIDGDQLKKRIEGSSGPSCELVLYTGGKQDGKLPAGVSDNNGKLLMTYYEDINLSVIEESKGSSGTDKVIFVTEGRAAKDLYMRWSGNAYSPEPSSMRIEINSSGYNIEAGFVRKDKEDNYLEEYRNPGIELNQEMLDLFSSSRLKKVAVIVSLPSLEREREVFNVLSTVSHDVKIYIAGAYISDDVTLGKHVNALTLTECNVSGTDWSFMNVDTLSMTACPGLKWDSFISADKVRVLDLNKDFGSTCEEAKKAGYYPESFSVFLGNDSLKQISFTVSLMEEEMPDEMKHMKLTYADGDVPKELEYLLPYPLEEMRKFLKDPEREIWINWE